MISDGGRQSKYCCRIHSEQRSWLPCVVHASPSVWHCLSSMCWFRINRIKGSKKRDRFVKHSRIVCFWASGSKCRAEAQHLQSQTDRISSVRIVIRCSVIAPSAFPPCFTSALCSSFYQWDHLHAPVNTSKADSFISTNINAADIHRDIHISLGLAQVGLSSPWATCPEWLWLFTGPYW